MILEFHAYYHVTGIFTAYEILITYYYVILHLKTFQN